MQVLKLYSVQVWDGGGRHNHKFFLTNKDEADRYIKDNTYDLVYEQTIEIFDTLDEWKEWNTGKVKERALSKLTAEERRALGY
jgi:hypothetical protein